MQRSWGIKLIGACLAAILVTACKDQNSFQSSVPRYPVSVTINTNSGEFVHFNYPYSYVLVDAAGYHFNGHVVQPLTVMDAYGYGGVVVYIDVNGTYNAFDMACPYCAGRALLRPCLINGIFAKCPECGEEYDLGSGTAAPQNGVARESLLRLQVNNSGGQIIVRQ
jgi:nitrite reductase/ring-hydroxylating ferredoxin subunit